MTALLIERGKIRILRPKQRRSDRRLPIRAVIDLIVIEYEHQGVRKRVTIAPGFWFDGISANWYLRFWLYLLGGRSKLEICTALHDLLCQSHIVSKAEADHAFNEIMLALKVWSPIRKVMFDAVSGSATRNNWPQPNLKASNLTAEGWPLFFDQCPIEAITAAG
ncbi:DUF1353 domain-containing protein [Sphingomonadaceae bacterium G21617-S1]|nr:DUF1353 domain-containing protein [Sphingomonadaceae bacterium G21617-S1]